MNLMDKFANPELVHNLALSEKLAGAGITTVMGMGVTFVVLILLWFCIVVLTKIMTRPKPAADAQAVAAVQTQSTVLPQKQEPETTQDMLPVVVAAAVAAFENEQTFVVKKIRRV